MKDGSRLVIEKRVFLKTMLASSIILSLPSCSLFCSSEPLPDFESDQFIADIHCHIFNAKDLPVFGFVKYVALGSAKFPGVNTFAGILVKTITAIATPGFSKEKNRLEKLINKSNKGLMTEWDDEDLLNKELFKTTFNQQINNINLKVNNKIQMSNDELELMIYIKSEVNVNKIEKSGVVDWYKKLTSISSKIGRYLLWGYKMTKYRYQHIAEIKKTYPDVQLFTPALIDFDRWLSSTEKHSDTQVSVKQQMELSVLHNKLNNGSIHPFVPFDPLRDVETDGQVYTDTVEYIKSYGAIGIKLYPPMGFRVYQNSELKFCHSNIENLGMKIDKSLLKIYSYCHENEIPILAHTADSNYNFNCKDYKGRANPIYWEEVLKKFKNLRINMGHFATHSLLGNEWSLTIRRLMLAYPNVYADFSHIEGFDDKQYSKDFFIALDQFLNVDTTENRKKLLTRFLYGSDWIMLAKESISKNYFAHLVKYFDIEFGSQGNDTVRNNFIGGNAYNYLGLNNSKTTQRLKAFYIKNAIELPTWLESI